ncbi:MAG: hypothetical protein FJZ86_15940 [Chloroflexi bacterium]|nr:hypothetical protein [Chloroflexota bacterium]
MLFGLAYQSQAFLFGWLINLREVQSINADPMRDESRTCKARRKAMLRNFKILFVVVVVVIISVASYAFAAANTVPDSAAGYKSNVVPGYTVTNIVYDLDATDPTLVDAITFDIAPSSGTVIAAVVKLQTATAGAWTSCTLVAGVAPSMAVTCTYGALELVNVTALNIVASSSLDP